MKDQDRKEQARRREVALAKRRKSNEQRARSRAIEREGMRSITLTVHDDAELIEAVKAYAHELSHAASYPVNETRDTAMVPLKIDVVDVPRIREMVRRYAEALSNAWLYAGEHPLPHHEVASCQDCGAPRLEVKLSPSDRPYAVSSNLSEHWR